MYTAAVVRSDLIGPVVFLGSYNLCPLTCGLVACYGQYSSEWTLPAAGVFIVALPSSWPSPSCSATWSRVASPGRSSSKNVPGGRGCSSAAGHAPPGNWLADPTDPWRRAIRDELMMNVGVRAEQAVSRLQRSLHLLCHPICEILGMAVCHFERHGHDGAGQRRTYSSIAVGAVGSIRFIAIHCERKSWLNKPNDREDMSAVPGWDGGCGVVARRAAAASPARALGRTSSECRTGKR
jgi:hypothetical protein